MRTEPHESVRREDGIALLIAVLLLMLVSAIGIAAIEHSGGELASGGRARSSTVAFYGADAGLNLAVNQIAQEPPDLTPVNVTLTDGTLVRSGTRTDTVPQPLLKGGTGLPPEGYSLNTGSGYVNRRSTEEPSPQARRYTTEYRPHCPTECAPPFFAVQFSPCESRIKTFSEAFC